MIERKFVQDKIKEKMIQDYLEKELERADYSHTDIRMTPLSTRLIIYVGRPGFAIGRGGAMIKKLTEDLKNKFGVKNPHIDIQQVENPYLDARIVAKNIAQALEQHVSPARITNIYLRNIMEAGAVGAEIVLSGKLSGARGRSDKRMVGYIKKCGDMADEVVSKGFAIARLKPGVIGVKVRIMPRLPKSVQLEKQVKEKVRALDKKKLQTVEEALEEARGDHEIEVPEGTVVVEESKGDVQAIEEMVASREEAPAGEEDMEKKEKTEKPAKKAEKKAAGRASSKKKEEKQEKSEPAEKPTTKNKKKN